MDRLIYEINLFLLILSTLNVWRHAYLFSQLLKYNRAENENLKYTLDNRNLFILGISVSFIMVKIMNGIWA